MARELQAREKEKKEQELRDLAMRARMERGGAGYAPPPAAARGAGLAVGTQDRCFMLHVHACVTLCLFQAEQLFEAGDLSACQGLPMWQFTHCQGCWASCGGNAAQILVLHLS